MPSTSVHFPEQLLQELNRLAAERGISRNRLIVESCRRAVGSRTTWPAGFFSNDHLQDDELAELHACVEEFTEILSASRRSRKEPPF